MTNYKIDKGNKTIYCTIVTEGLEFYGKAKCAKNDTFEEEKGKRIAYLKALLKVKKYDLLLAENYINWLINARNKALNILNKNAIAYKDIQTELYKLSN